jgi:hypothetical protein
VSEQEPVLRVIRGDATSEDIAAVLGALMSVPPQPPRERPRRVWGAPGTNVRLPLNPGPGAWRASGLPR